LAEYAKGRISINRILKWPKLAESRSSGPSLARARFSPLDLAKEGTQGSVENICSFHEKSRILYEFELF
jgi:hypothetical protein